MRRRANEIGNIVEDKDPVLEQYPFLTIKEGDSASIKGMKTYWHMVKSMPEPERKVFLQEERVKDEEHHLQWMIDSNKHDDQQIELYKRYAKSAYLDYKMLYAEESARAAEAWLEMAKSTKQTRYTIADIRRQRERVQWEKQKLKTMQPSEEPSTS